MLQLEVIAVLVGDGNKVRAEFFTPGDPSRCIVLDLLYPDLKKKARPGGPKFSQGRKATFCPVEIIKVDKREYYDIIC